MNPHLTLARRRSSQALHPGYIRAVASKPTLPAEIYTYPAAARRDATVVLHLPAAAPVIHERAAASTGLRVIGVVVLFAVWAAAANVTPGV